MSQNTHIMAVVVSEVEAAGGLVVDNFFDTPGLSWCGETFETGYVFSEQVDLIIGPLASPALRSVLLGEQQAMHHPIIDQFGQLEEGLEIRALTPELYGEFRSVVATAIATADWGAYDTYEWDQLLADDQTTGDFYLIIEFV